MASDVVIAMDTFMLNDFSPVHSGGELDATELASYMLEVREQPAWRRRADEEADYYDGNQLDAETLQAMAELGMAPVVENLTASTVDAVLGMEAKTRLDWQVTAADDEQFGEVAEAINHKLNEVERHSRADRACSDAYADQIKVGLGWVEVTREIDPFKYPYVCNRVHRNEVFWDWRAKQPDLSDARYFMRRRWYDVDEIRLAMPGKEALLDYVGTGWHGFDPMISAEGDETTSLGMDYARERGWTIEEMEWRDINRRRLCLMEVWYRRWTRGYVLRLPDGRVVEYNQTDPMHTAAVLSGAIVPEQSLFSRWRLSWWVGPHKLEDMENPYRHGKLPYVPFWGKREDRTGVPYGLIRAMRPMQDEVNARKTKMIWLLSAKRITMTNGVTLDDPDLVRQEASRPDAVHVLDPAKMQAGGIFKVESDFQLNAQQYQALSDNREAIKNVAGVYNAMLGKDGGANSGIAIQSLVEQGTTTLAEINDNQRYARAQVGDLLMSLVIEDMAGKPVSVSVKNEYGSDKRISLNSPFVDPQTGMRALDNDVQRANLKIALSDVPSTASFRAQRLAQLVEITKSLPPNLQALVVDFVMLATDLPERHKITERLRKAIGIQEEGAGNEDPNMPKTPEELQQVLLQTAQHAAAEALNSANAKAQELEMQLKARSQDLAETKARAEISARERELEIKETEQAFKAAGI